MLDILYYCNFSVDGGPRILHLTAARWPALNYSAYTLASP